MRLKKIGLIIAAVASLFFLKSTPIATALLSEAFGEDSVQVEEPGMNDSTVNYQDSIPKARLFRP